MSTLTDLARSEKLFYLASPYSRFPTGIDAAFEEISRIGGELIFRGVRFFCPIAHSHPISKHGGVDPYDHSIWLPAMKPLMDACDVMLIAQMDGWRESYGIGEEIKAFRAMQKPILELCPRTLHVCAHRISDVGGCLNVAQIDQGELNV
ncbi:MAG TPA: DUF1937 family protein [Rhizomicrobium sp.]|nr:DUF1937 family protein [Rhizomicrobium sp.]